MQTRLLGKTGWKVSTVALGTWQIGGTWGSDFDPSNAEHIMNTALDLGINFIDTADVYSDGESEKAVGKAVNKARSQGKTVYIASKCGRRIQPHVNGGYTPEVLRRYVEDSLTRLGTERIDLIQLHCPPTEVYYRPEIFGLFDKLRAEGKIGYLGVSVEKVEEAIKAVEFPSVASVQIIFNMFRHRPSERFFPIAKEKNVGVIVRVPLASGLLSGSFGTSTQFSPGDHRRFNRDGAAFDKGETFSGVPYETGLAAVEELKKSFGSASLASAALRWVLMFPEVSTVIPGASKPDQVRKNAAAADLSPLTDKEMAAVSEVYKGMIAPYVHQLW